MYAARGILYGAALVRAGLVCPEQGERGYPFRR